MKLKMTLLTVGVISVVGLAGCKAHQNTLLTEPKLIVAKALYQAQYAAMEKTKLYDATNNVYKNCVTNPEHYDSPFLPQEKRHPCPKFLLIMASHLQKTKTFSEVTVSDLKNPAVIKRLGDWLFAYTSTNGQDDQARSVMKTLHR